MTINTRDALTNEYVAWLTVHSLPEESADELLCELHASGVHTHDEWLNDFINRWEDMENNPN